MQLLDLSTDMLFACTNAISCHLNIHTILAQQTLHIQSQWQWHPHMASTHVKGQHLEIALELALMIAPAPMLVSTV
jgi:hypothetical protein